MIRKKGVYFILFVFCIAFEQGSLSQTKQERDYHAMALDLESNVKRELAKIPDSQKEKYKKLAQELSASVKVMNEDKKDLLELNNKILQKVNQEVAETYDNNNKASTSSPAELPDKQIYIFVSSSMRKSNLISLAKQASAQGASVVMRGFIENSYLKTAEFLKSVTDQTGQGVVIDPSLFETYVITEVPSFVVSYGNEYDKLTGNVSLAYAIGEITNKGEALNNNNK